MTFSEFEEHIALLERFYAPSNVTIELDDGDDTTKGPYYEILEPVRHEGWSLQNVPTTNSLALAHKWIGEDNFIAPALLDPVLDVDHQHKWVVLKCQAHTAQKFIYSVLMDSTSQFFSLTP